MRANVHASPDDIDITSLWSVIRRAGPRILLVSAGIGALTYAGLSFMPPLYKSEAQIRIGGQGIADPFRDPKVGAGPTSEVIAVKVDKEAIASQVVALRSRDLAAKLATELKLATRPEFNDALAGQNFLGGMMRLVGLSGPRPGETEEERVFANFYKALQVYQVKDTRVITVEFQSRDSELSAKAANRLVELYQQWLRSQGVTSTQDASEWLKPQIDKLAREVALAEAEVERFRSKANLFRGSGLASAGLNEQQLSDLSTEVTRTRAARGEAEARARSARELLQRGLAESITDVQKSPVIQGLIAQRVRAEREKAEAETALLSGHPRMKQLQANVNDLRRQVNREAIVVVEGLEKEAKLLALREELALKSLDEMKARVGATSSDIARLANLEGAAKAKRKELETLQASFEATRSRGDVKSVPLEAQVLSSARPSSVPSSPKKPQLAGLATAASMILGFVLVVTRELLGGARRSGTPQPAQAPAPAPVTVQAATPARRSDPAPRPPVAAAPPQEPAPTQIAMHAVAETVVPAVVAPTAAIAAAIPATPAAYTRLGSVDALSNRLIANSDGQGGYRTVVVGDSDEVDVAEVAADLVDTLSAAGRQVVLVDWSLDGTGISDILGLAPSPGFLDLVEGRATFEDVIRRLPEGDAHIVPCGGSKITSAAALDAERLNLVLDALDEAYDHIVVMGRHKVISDLFLATQGRFDAGILVADPRQPERGTETAAGMFLGFPVTEIDLVRFESGVRPAARPADGAGREAHI